MVENAIAGAVVEIDAIRLALGFVTEPAAQETDDYVMGCYPKSIISQTNLVAWGALSRDRKIGVTDINGKPHRGSDRLVGPFSVSFVSWSPLASDVSVLPALLGRIRAPR